MAIPAATKYTAFLKTGIFGVYIQKVEKTKNRSEATKKMFRKNKGLSVVAL